MAAKYRIQYVYTPDNLSGEIITERPDSTTENLPERKEAFAQFIKLLDANPEWDLSGTNLTGTYAHSDNGTTWVTDATIHQDNDYLFEFDYIGSDETTYTQDAEFYDVYIKSLTDVFHIMEKSYNDVSIVSVSHT